MKFCSEYLFPRFKFLEKGWIVHNPELEEMHFSVFVKRHLPLPDDVVFEEKWDTLIAPTIVKRYTDMRCDVNGFVRATYLSEYAIISLLLFWNSSLVELLMILFYYAGKGNLHDGRTLIIPDDYTSGVTYFQEEGRKIGACRSILQQSTHQEYLIFLSRHNHCQRHRVRCIID